jgi:uncharacterized protein (TIRG00374 family)
VKRRILRNAYQYLLAAGQLVYLACKKNRRILWHAFQYLLAAGLFVYVVCKYWGVPEDEKGLAYVWQKVLEGRAINYQFLVLTILIYGIGTLLTFIRWYFLVRAQDLPFTLPSAVRLGLVGLYYNIFLPGAIGGDIIRAAGIARQQNRRTVAVATVFLDRAIALWGLIWFVALLGAVFWVMRLLQGEFEAKLQKIVLSAAAIVGASLVACLFLRLLPERRAQRFAGRLSRIPRVGHSAAEAWRAFWMYRCRPGSVLVALLIALAGHVCFVLTYYFAALTLAEPDQIPTPVQHFLIVPIGMVISAIPGFPGGAGVAELGFSELYKWLGKSPAYGTLGSIVQRIATWTLGLVGYLIYLRMRAPGRADSAECADEPVAYEPQALAVLSDDRCSSSAHAQDAITQRTFSSS